MIPRFDIRLVKDRSGRYNVCIKLITYYMSDVFLQFSTCCLWALYLSRVNLTTGFISVLVPVWLRDYFGRELHLIYIAIE